MTDSLSNIGSRMAEAKISSALSLNKCVGKGKYNLSHLTNWHGFVERPISKDTRCEYCANHLTRLGELNLYGLASYSERIDCDSLTDANLSSMIYKGFQFSVRSPDGKTPFLVHPEKSDVRSQGVLVVEMPEVQDYRVEIDTGKFGDIYYTYEMSVGSRTVIVNDGLPIYYNDKTNVLGFTSGSNDSFRFVAEKKRSEFAHVPGINAPDSNLITIRIRTFRRERVHLRPYFDAPTTFPRRRTWRGGRSDFFGDQEESYDEGSPGDMFGCPMEGPDCTRSLGNKKSGLVTRCNTEGISPAAASGVTGGSTVTGGSYVGNVATTTTSDRFIPTGSFAVTIQLIHVDDERYQKPLIADRLRQQAEDHTRQRVRTELDAEIARQRTLLAGDGKPLTPVVQQPVPVQPEPNIPVTYPEQPRNPFFPRTVLLTTSQPADQVSIGIYPLTNATPTAPQFKATTINPTGEETLMETSTPTVPTVDSDGYLQVGTK